jgi:hypothetical protein
MKNHIILLFAFCLIAGTTIAQVPEGQPRQHQEQYEELRDEELEQEAPAQQPQQLEQEGEVTPPGQQEEDIERAEEFEADPKQEGGEANIDRYEYEKTIKYRELPELVKNDLENGYFNDWKVKEVYEAQTGETDESIPTDYVIKVEKQDAIMYLHYQGNGALLMQEVWDFD